MREPKYSWFDGECTKYTDAEGNLPRRRWLAHVRKDTKNGGPVHWISENYQCKEKCKTSEPYCCLDVGVCRADSVAYEDDPDINGGCEKFSFISGLDEMALQSEIGLYFDFNVTDDGIPFGCPGFEVFDGAHFNISYNLMWTTLPKQNNPNQRYKSDPQCGPNTLEYPSGSTPLYKIFEDYAANQQNWLNDFVPSLEKMLSNGYNSLTLGPDQATDIICNRPGEGSWYQWKYTNCYPSTEIQSKTLYRSRFDMQEFCSVLVSCQQLKCKNLKRGDKSLLKNCRQKVII